MKQERVFTCPETEDLTRTCHLCGHGIERHGPDYECYEKPITQKKHNMEAKHPTKWEFNGESVLDEKGHNVCTKANARLIASAPQLLEALKVALWNEENGEAESQKQGKPRLIERLELYRNAIARAEGRA